MARFVFIKTENNSVYRPKRGFTLIELLVVIAIVALLLSIITPALKRAKEYAKFLTCKANLKGYHVAMKLYLTDDDGMFPLSHTSIFNGLGTGISGSCQWHDERISPWKNPRNAGPLWQYMENMEMHMCPTFEVFARSYGSTHPDHNTAIPVKPQYSYSQNHYLGAVYSQGPLGVLKETDVVKPGGVMLFVEETIWLIPGLASHVLNDTCFWARHTSDPAGFVGDCIATYHNTTLQRKDEGWGNAVFVDGHVELVNARDKAGNVSASFRLAWPKRGTYSTTCPYNY